MSEYRPIDCALHSEYELAVMHNRPLQITWRQTDGQLRVEVLMPRDLRTRNHEEFLIAERSNGQRLELRLDAIVKTETV